jgi:hypothetical protein
VIIEIVVAVLFWPPARNQEPGKPSMSNDDILNKLKPIDAELARCARALKSMVPSPARAETLARIDVLVDERARALGVPEDEIAKINRDHDPTEEEIAAILGSLPTGEE